MDRKSLVFCVLSLLVSLGLAALAYPHAAMLPEAVAAARTPADAETMKNLDLGDFGKVSVQELIDFYIDNPPEAPAPGAASVRAVRFQGC